MNAYHTYVITASAEPLYQYFSKSDHPVLVRKDTSYELTYLPVGFFSFRNINEFFLLVATNYFHFVRVISTINMFHRRCIVGVASLATTILLSGVLGPVDSFIVVSTGSKNGPLHRTILNDSLMAPEVQSSFALQRSEVKKSSQIFTSCFGILCGLITLMAPLNFPLVSEISTVANAADSKVVGSFSGSGLFFKDTLQVESFDDSKVQGVKLYVSNFILPINERLSSAKNLLSDPTSASLTCAKTGPIKLADTIVKGTGGEQVFEESKSLLFKSLKVQRVYDEEDKTLIYVSYNTRLDKKDDSNKSRFKSSICAIGLE